MSKEAMDAAEKLVSAIQDDDDVGIWNLYICGIHAESYIAENSARKDERDVRAQIAMAFDLHAAALRAEVEALRAERDELLKQRGILEVELTEARDREAKERRERVQSEIDRTPKSLDY